jgi:hypothetical protein
VRIMTSFRFVAEIFRDESDGPHEWVARCKAPEWHEASGATQAEALNGLTAVVRRGLAARAESGDLPTEKEDTAGAILVVLVQVEYEHAEPAPRPPEDTQGYFY